MYMYFARDVCSRLSFRTVGCCLHVCMELHEGVPLDWNDNKIHIHIQTRIEKCRQRHRERDHPCLHSQTPCHPAHVHASLSSCLFRSLVSLRLPLFDLVPTSLRTDICLRRITNSSTPSSYCTLYISLSLHLGDGVCSNALKRKAIFDGLFIVIILQRCRSAPSPSSLDHRPLCLVHLPSFSSWVSVHCPV